MSTIVVGVDGTPESEDAVAFAGRLARAAGTRLALVNAYPYNVVAGVEAREVDAALRGESEETLDRIRGVLDAGVDATIHAVADPSPARALHEFAARCDAGLIVVGSSHVGRLGRVFPGSTAERRILFMGSRAYGSLHAVLLGGTSGRVIRDAACPVLVAPRGAGVDAALATPAAAV